MVTRWLTTGYEIPFTQAPTKLLSAKNNKSCYNNIQFTREELKRQVKCGILSEVSYTPQIINPISCVYTNKWRLVVDGRLLNPYVVKRKIGLGDLSCVPAMVSKDDLCQLTTLKKYIGKFIWTLTIKIHWCFFGWQVLCCKHPNFGNMWCNFCLYTAGSSSSWIPKISWR